MTLRDHGVYLEDIEHHPEAAMRFAADCDLTAYLAGDKTRAAVERALEICGEAMRQLDRIAPDVAKAFRTRARSSAFATSSRMAMPDSITPRSSASSRRTPRNSCAPCARPCRLIQTPARRTERPPLA